MPAKTKTTKVTIPVVQKPVAAAAAPAEAEASPATPAVARPSSDEVFEQTLKDAQNLVVAARGMVARVRELKRTHDRELKESKRASKKNRKQSGGAPRPPTGFAKPTKISDALADFLKNVAGNADVNRGDLMTRTEATKRLNAYFIAKDLRDSEDKRKIHYQKDAALAKLIKLPAGTELTYFNLQTAIKEEFPKA